MVRTAGEPLLRVNGLKTYFFVSRGIVKSVDGVSFSLERGESLGLVGESGCGKSVTGLSILRLIDSPPGKIVAGQVLFEGEDLLEKSEHEMVKIRGSKITMIQQNPDNSLNPVFRVGNQVSEAISAHQRLNRKAVWEKTLEMLRLVRIASPEMRALDYPHQMSGGMRQRVAGAIALSCQASVIIADEPTTNLDVTTQMEYVNLLKQIQHTTGVGIIFVSHDLGVVARLCHRICVMYAGRIVESGPTGEIIREPKHPYTRALLDSMPQPGAQERRLRSIEGEPPDPINLPPNCTFATRCPRASGPCLEEYPSETSLDRERSVRCFHAG